MRASAPWPITRLARECITRKVKKNPVRTPERENARDAVRNASSSTSPDVILHGSCQGSPEVPPSILLERFKKNPVRTPKRANARDAARNASSSTSPDVILHRSCQGSPEVPPSIPRQMTSTSVRLLRTGHWMSNCSIINSHKSFIDKIRGEIPDLEFPLDRSNARIRMKSNFKTAIGQKNKLHSG